MSGMPPTGYRLLLPGRFEWACTLAAFFPGRLDVDEGRAWSALAFSDRIYQTKKITARALKKDRKPDLNRVRPSVYYQRPQRAVYLVGRSHPYLTTATAIRHQRPTQQAGSDRPTQGPDPTQPPCRPRVQRCTAFSSARTVIPL